MANFLFRASSWVARCEGPLWLLLIYLVSFSPDMKHGFSGAWVVSGLGLIILLRMKRRGLLWVTLGVTALAIQLFSEGAVFSIAVLMAGCLFVATMVFQSWFAWRAVVWLENRRSSRLLSRSSDVFPFAIYACLLPAVLASLIWVLSSILFYDYQFTAESVEPSILNAARHAMGLLLIGSLYWAANQWRRTPVFGILFGWLFFIIPVLLNEEIYFGLAILAYPAAILVAKWLRFFGIALAVAISSILSLSYITLSVESYEPHVVVEWLLDAVLFSTTLGIVSLYSAIAFEELEVRGEQLEVLVAKRTIDLEEANQRLTEMASVDPLTGIANRRQWNSRAEVAVAQSVFTAEPLSVLIIDIDHFKQVNDLHGHDVGDMVLKQFARLCADQLRTSDTFARLGGEEFAVMLQGVDLYEAQDVAAKLHQSIKSAAFIAEKQRIPVTASIGIAELRAHEDTLSIAMKRADEALYKAKQSGRDRVVLEPNLKVS